MRRCIALVWTASALFLAGCRTGPHATKWEYKVAYPHIPRGDANRVEGPEGVRAAQEAFLNDLAKDGWIFVSQTDGRYFYFKRPMR